MKKFLILFCIALVGFSNGDSQKELIKLNWEFLLDSNSDEFYKLTFENAAYLSEFPEIPVYSKIIDVKNSTRDFLFSIENPVFEELEFKVTVDVLNRLSQNIYPESYILSSNGERKCYLQIIPAKRDGDKVLVLKSFELKSTPVTTKSAKAENITWKSESVLKQGKWVKIATTKQGIYKIPYSKLIEWGFSNPANVNVFGAGGTILSEDPGVVEFDDLPQNSVWYGKNNGTDCLFFYAKGISDWYFDAKDSLFKHRINDYSTKGYYFLSDAGGSSNLVTVYPEIQDEALQVVTSGDVYDVYEKELKNVLSGEF